MPFENRQDERQDDECNERSRGQLVQKRRGAARAERRLRTASSECPGDVRSLPLLDEHDQDQEEADEHVNDDRGDVSESHVVPPGEKGTNLTFQDRQRQGAGSGDR